MRWELRLLLCVLGILASQYQVRADFVGGHLYYSSNSNGGVFDITGGGNFSGSSPIANGPVGNLGQLAFSPDLSIMYGTQYNAAAPGVYRVTAGGTATLYAAVDQALGLVVTQDGRLLVASRNGGRILDVTNPSHVTTYATIAANIRNMVQLPTGEILVAGDSAGRSAIWNVTSGTPTIWATFGGNEAADIDYTSTGRVFATSWWGAGAGLYDVTGGGNFSTPYAKLSDGTGLFGLAIDRATDRIYTASAGKTFVLDVTSGGTFADSAVGAWATNIPTTNDTALDFAPTIAPSAPLPTSASMGIVLMGVCAALVGARKILKPAGTRF